MNEITIAFNSNGTNEITIPKTVIQGNNLVDRLIATFPDDVGEVNMVRLHATLPNGASMAGIAYFSLDSATGNYYFDLTDYFTQYSGLLKLNVSVQFNGVVVGYDTVVVEDDLDALNALPTKNVAYAYVARDTWIVYNWSGSAFAENAELSYDIPTEFLAAFSLYIEPSSVSVGNAVIPLDSYDELLLAINNAAGRINAIETKDISYDAHLENEDNPHLTSWSNLLDKPTTISGFGITDAYTEGEVDSAIETYVASLAGANNGLATLGSDGKIPSSQIPSLALTEPFVVSSEAAMLALDAQQGDQAIRTDLGLTYMLAASPASTLSNWVLFAAFNKTALGLGNVDNTSDLNKPISTATQAALDAKSSIVDIPNKISDPTCLYANIAQWTLTNATASNNGNNKIRLTSTDTNSIIQYNNFPSDNVSQKVVYGRFTFTPISGTITSVQLLVNGSTVKTISNPTIGTTYYLDGVITTSNASMGIFQLSFASTSGAVLDCVNATVLVPSLTSWQSPYLPSAHVDFSKYEIAEWVNQINSSISGQYVNGNLSININALINNKASRADVEHKVPIIPAVDITMTIANAYAQYGKIAAIEGNVGSYLVVIFYNGSTYDGQFIGTQINAVRSFRALSGTTTIANAFNASITDYAKLISGTSFAALIGVSSTSNAGYYEIVDDTSSTYLKGSKYSLSSSGVATKIGVTYNTNIIPNLNADMLDDKHLSDMYLFRSLRIYDNNVTSGEGHWGKIADITMPVQVIDRTITFIVTGAYDEDYIGELFVRIRNNNSSTDLNIAGSYAQWRTLKKSTTFNENNIMLILDGLYASIWAKTSLANYGGISFSVLSETDRYGISTLGSWNLYSIANPTLTDLSTISGTQKVSKIDILSSEAWTIPTLLNSWAAYDTDEVSFYKDCIGRIHLRGRIAGGTDSSTLLILPTGYRPSQYIEFYASQNSNSNIARIGISPNGTVNIYYDSFSTYISLSLVEFRAA